MLYYKSGVTTIQQTSKLIQTSNEMIKYLKYELDFTRGCQRSVMTITP